jgi:arylsulfatase B
MQGAERYLERFSQIEDIHRRIFAAMLAHLDESVGRILQKLRELNLEEQTLVVFLSDNGGPTRELTSSNLPLRGGKGQPARRVEDRPVISLDIYATALAAAGAAPPEDDAPRDGVNLLPFVAGSDNRPPHSQLYWRVGQNAALREGDWKLVRQAAGRRASAPWRLYNLSADLAESQDLAQGQPQVLERMIKAWTAIDAMMPRP